MNKKQDNPADPAVYNRFIYSIVQPDPYYIPSEDNDDYQIGDIAYVFHLEPMEHSDEEYFTDEKKDEILTAWYESIFKSIWANPEVGTVMVELVDGTPTIPEKIRFTIDPTVLDMTEEGGLEHQHPTGLLGLGTLRRTWV